MGAFARLIASEVSKSLAKRSKTGRYLLMIPAGAAALIAVLAVMTLTIVFAVVITQNAGGCGTTVPVGAAGATIKTAAQAVQYFESQGITANGSAGIVGNLQQESGLNPAEAGGGLAQWLGARWTAMVAWVTAQHLDPNSMEGQLTYIVYDLRTGYAKLLTELNSAPDAATGATMFETVYEGCSGVLGYLIVAPGSLCNDPARRAFAVAALGAAGGGTSTPIGTGGGATCLAVGGPGGDPIPGFTPGRDDMGVDACAKPNMPIFAPADSKLVDVIPNWFTSDAGSPQPLLEFQFTQPLAGAYQNDQYWYVAEQIVPVTTTIGTLFGSGQPVAWFAAAGTCIEIGWGSPTNGSRTLVPGDAHPAAGALTPEAEAFKTYFHIPWVGQSP